MFTTQKQFEQLKSFALRNNIVSCLTTLNAPVENFDNNRLYEREQGSDIKFSGFISQFIMNALKQDKTLCFSADNYNTETGVLTVSGQDFYPNEDQVKCILQDNFGAIEGGYRSFYFLNKVQFDFNSKIDQDRKLASDFVCEVERLKKLLKIEEDFLRAKADGEKYGVAELLAKWEKPLFPPQPPENTSSSIKMSGFISNNYFAEIAKGIEIRFAEHFDHESGLIHVIGHKFKPEPEQLEALQRDGVAYLSDVNGFTHFSTLEQSNTIKQHIEASKAFRECRYAVDQAQEQIYRHRYAEKCTAQHQRFAQLPFPYYVAIKVNIRLLTENSWGDGAKRNTVYHIVPKVALTGRLKRKENEYLCGGSSSYGTPTKEHDASTIGYEYPDVMQEVSCKRCLEIAEKMLTKAKV